MSPGWGAVVRDPEPPLQGCPASYDWRGWRYEWRVDLPSEARTALDVERLDTPRPGRLVPRGWTTERFLAAWTRAEVMAKLLEIPVLLWIKANPLRAASLGRWSEEAVSPGPGCHVVTGVHPSLGVVYSCGWAEADPSESSRVARPTPVDAAGTVARRDGVEQGESDDDQS